MFVAVSHWYFTVKSELDMDLALVIAMDFMKVFLLFLRLEQGSGPLESQNPPLVTPSSIVPIKATNSAETKALFYGGQKFLSGGALRILTTIFYYCHFGFGEALPPLAPSRSCGSGYKRS